jgi:dihydroorotate dehydrogenase electron transfer subunit
LVAKRRDSKLKIISNKHLCGDYYIITFACGSEYKTAAAGQFCMLSVPGRFLRRPISIYKTEKGKLHFLYKIAGEGTKFLSKLKKGDTSQVLGPLGAGYNVKAKGLPVIVAGGTGIASVHFLATKLKTKGVLYYGARSKEDLLCLKEFKKLGWKIEIATENGTAGRKGYVTDIIKLTDKNILYACGPTPMLKKVAAFAKEKNVKGFVSLEEKMACGLGNCQGCAVKVGDVYKMTCKDGPVFKIEDVEL